MKAFLKKFAVCLLLINIALTVQMSIAHADEEGATPSKPSGIISPLEYLELVEGTNKLPDFTATGQHPDSVDLLPGVGTFTSPIYFALDFFRYVMSGIALVMVITVAIKLVSTDSEEKASEEKQLLVVGVVGLIVIQLADTIVKKMVFGEQGDAFESVASAQFYGEESTHQLRGIIGFFHAMLGAAAVLVIVIRGATLLYETEDEAITKAKTHVVYALIGLAVVGLSEVIVRGFVFPERGERLPDVKVAREVIVAVTNYLSSFVAIFAFLALFYAGYLYTVSGGKEDVNEKVKKIFLGAVIALILALGAFAVINTFVTLDETLPTKV